MKSLIAFTKKEAMEQVRSGYLLLLLILFCMLGIMNPAIAKLTPWLLEMMEESLAQSGMTIVPAEVTAMDSWVQFYKNMPLGLIAFLLIECGILSKEYQTGTLVLALTKGLSRTTVLISKALTLFLLWSGCYWLCFGITYAYNAYFWDNSIAAHLGLSALFWWVFGILTISLLLFFSVLFTSSSGALVGTGAVILVSYVLEFFPDLRKLLPTRLSDGTSLIAGAFGTGDYLPALIVCILLSLFFLVGTIPIFRKKLL